MSNTNNLIYMSSQSESVSGKETEGRRLRLSSSTTSWTEATPRTLCTMLSASLGICHQMGSWISIRSAAASVCARTCSSCHLVMFCCHSSMFSSVCCTHSDEFYDLNSLFACCRFTIL